MKIALVTPYDYPYPGGVTEHVRHLDREFRARGHETRIIAPSSEPDDALESHVIKVSGQVESIPVNGSTARITLSSEVASRVQAILDREQFDVVHLHEPEAPLLGWTALHSSHAINVGTFHAYREDSALYKYAGPLMQWINTRLDGRIFVSPVVREELSPYLPGESRVIPNGIDYPHFAARGVAPIAGFDDSRPNLLFVGRLDARKGFQHLMEAYPYVKSEIPNVRLLVVGAFGAEEQAPFVEYVRANHLRDVQFIGRVSDTELARYYRSATVFCAPSTGGESFGIVLLEAMAAGIPIVASDIAGYRCVMQDGVEGALVRVGDETGIAEALIALLRDPQRRERMAIRGRATASQYDWRVVAPRVLEYYEELIRERARSRKSTRALRSPRPIPDKKATAVSLAFDGLMTGLSLLGTEPAPDRGEPDGPYLWGARKVVAAGALPIRMNATARVRHLFKLELAMGAQ